MIGGGGGSKNSFVKFCVSKYIVGYIGGDTPPQQQQQQSM